MPIAKKVNFKLIEGRKYANVVNIIYPVVIIVLFAISVIFIVTGHTGDFIHFNF